MNLARSAIRAFPPSFKLLRLLANFDVLGAFSGVKGLLHFFGGKNFVISDAAEQGDNEDEGKTAEEGDDPVVEGRGYVGIEAVL